MGTAWLETTMSSNNLQFPQLPETIKMEIAEAVDSPADLLHLSLCSRDMSAIILPAHIQLRAIIASFHQPSSFWHALVETPARAKRIRSLTLNSFLWATPGPRITFLAPTVLEDVEDVCSTANVVAAIHRMKCLVTFDLTMERGLSIRYADIIDAVSADLRFLRLGSREEGKLEEWATTDMCASALVAEHDAFRRVRPLPTTEVAFAYPLGWDS